MKSYNALVLCIVAWLLSHLLAPTEAVSQQIKEVIYLKDGSIIRGVITEQVPGIRVKIQTREGNILVCQVEQIDRIVKEPVVKKGGRKSPEFALGLSLGMGVMTAIDGVGQWYNEDVGKGFVFLAWSMASTALFLGSFELDYDKDGSSVLTNALALLGVGSRLVGYTVAAMDAYRSAKRKNEEKGYGKLPGSKTQEHPMLDIGLGKHGEIFVAFRNTFQMPFDAKREPITALTGRVA